MYLNRFERAVAVLEALPCDLLLTPHPAVSGLWERLETGAGLVDTDACRRHGATARQALARRLDSEG